MRVAVAGAALSALVLAAMGAPAVLPPLQAPSACERLAEPAPTRGLARLLPAPLPGWTADEPEPGSGPAALLGGGPSAARRYRAVAGPEKTVDVEVAAGTALVDSLVPLLEDPSRLVASPGSSVIDVAGRRALLRVSAEDRTAEVSLVLRGRTLVVVRASGTEGAAEVLAYARALDVGGLEAEVAP